MEVNSSLWFYSCSYPASFLHPGGVQTVPNRAVLDPWSCPPLSGAIGEEGGCPHIYFLPGLSVCWRSLVWRFQACLDGFLNQN